MDFTDDESALLSALPTDGTRLSNPVLQKKLKWDDDRYWATRDSLVDKGQVSRGKGRGGTVRRVVETPAEETISVPVPVSDGAAEEINVREVVQRELELYEPMAQVLRTDWARDRRANPLTVEVTALQGRRSTGGAWSRPDLVSLEIKTYAFVPGKFLEVMTFEVKPGDQINVQAVYEALAHRRSSTHAYVILHVPKAVAENVQEAVDDVRVVARSHGVGLIVATDPTDYQTWEELEEAQRVEPDPARLDAFISTQLSRTVQTKVARGLR